MIMFVADLFASLGPSSVCFILTFDPSVAFNHHQLLRYQMINSFFHSLSELLISILRITAKPGETKKDIMQHESCAMHLCAPKGSYSAAHAWLMKQPSSLGCVVGCCGKKNNFPRWMSLLSTFIQGSKVTIEWLPRCLPHQGVKWSNISVTRCPTWFQMLLSVAGPFHPQKWENEKEIVVCG